MDEVKATEIRDKVAALLEELGGEGVVAVTFGNQVTFKHVKISTGKAIDAIYGMRAVLLETLRR